jgi:hypothetical protein
MGAGVGVGHIGENATRCLDGDISRQQGGLVRARWPRKRVSSHRCRARDQAYSSSQRGLQSGGQVGVHIGSRGARLDLNIGLTRSRASAGPSDTGYGILARTQKAKPRSSRSRCRVRTSNSWAWVELNYRPHAYQACQSKRVDQQVAAFPSRSPRNPPYSHTLDAGPDRPERTPLTDTTPLCCYLTCLGDAAEPTLFREWSAWRQTAVEAQKVCRMP